MKLKFPKKLKKAYEKIRPFADVVFSTDITSFAAQAAFFLFLSLFPFSMLLLMVLQNTPELYNRLMTLSLGILPGEVKGVFETVLHDIGRVTATLAAVSFTALTALWSSASGMISIIRGLNAVCGKRETRSFLRLRIAVLGYTILLVFVLVITLAVIVVWGGLANRFSLAGTLFHGSGLVVRASASLLLSAVLFLFFTAVYSFLPAHRRSFRSVWVGAALAALGWMGFSFGFSIYAERFSHYSMIYGSLTSVAVLMLWLYTCMYILFFGMTINELIARAKNQQIAQPI